LQAVGAARQIAATVAILRARDEARTCVARALIATHSGGARPAQTASGFRTGFADIGSSGTDALDASEAKGARMRRVASVRRALHRATRAGDAAVAIGALGVDGAALGRGTRRRAGAADALQATGAGRVLRAG